MFTTIIILIAIFFAILAYKNFNFAIYSLFLLLPTYRVQFEFFGIPLNLLSIFVWALVFVWIFKNNKNIFESIKKTLQNPRRVISNKENVFGAFKWMVVLILVCAFAATIISPEPTKALGIFKAYFLEAIFVFVILVYSTKDVKQLKNIIYSLEILAILIFFVAIYQKFSGDFVFNTKSVLEQGRVTTLFGYPNANGLILVPIFFLTLINLFTDKKILLKILHVFVLTSSFAVIYLAKSESAIIAIIAGLFIFVVFKAIKNYRFVHTISVLIILVALLFPFLVPAPKAIDEPNTKSYSIKQKILLEDLSGQIRRQMYKETTSFLKDNPIFGAGLVGYQQKIINYHKFNYIEVFLYPHNIFLNFYVTLGFFGMIGFLFLALRLVGKLSKEYAKHNSKEALIILLAFLAIVIQGIVEVPYFKNDLSIIWWLIFAYSIAISSKKSAYSL